MLTRIKRLPVFIANQIAAGEVIERPASVVKELLENAIDAKASQISVEIGFGGLNLIKVSDNGLGILSDDLLLAIAPHATSKIKQLADLHAIQSMGFRGEALASISSVSRLIICSKPAVQEQAMRLAAVNQELKSCARNQGTTVEVHDIFFNAPVRKKFLKSARTEFQAIEMIVKRIAMSAPNIAMSLAHNGQILWQLSAALCKASMRARITKLLGKKFVDGASYIEADAEHAGMRLEGWLGDVNYQRSLNDSMWIYLNNRMVKDKLLNHAIKQAYSAVLKPGRYPVCLLYLTVNPAEVDVNVHPTKHEVRFQQARLVHDFIVSQVSRAVEVSAETPATIMATTTAMTMATTMATTMAMNRELPQLIYPLRFSTHSAQEKQAGLSHELQTSYAGCGLGPTSIGGWAKTQPTLSSFNATNLEKQVIALDEQFSLLLIDSEVYLADLAALKKQWFLQFLHQEVIPWAKRSLLVPIYYSDSARDFNNYQNYYLLLQQLGFELEVLDSSKLAVLTIPSVMPQLDIKSFLHAVFLLKTPSLSKFISMLTDSFLENSATMSQLQQTVFLDYLHSQREVLLNSTGLIKKLSPALCQELLHG